MSQWSPPPRRRRRWISPGCRRGGRRGVGQRGRRTGRTDTRGSAEPLSSAGLGPTVHLGLRQKLLLLLLLHLRLHQQLQLCLQLLGLICDCCTSSCIYSCACCAWACCSCSCCSCAADTTNGGGGCGCVTAQAGESVATTVAAGPRRNAMAARALKGVLATGCGRRALRGRWARRGSRWAR